MARNEIPTHKHDVQMADTKSWNFKSVGAEVFYLAGVLKRTMKIHIGVMFALGSCECDSRV